eukprot:1814815-Rhodomonas_salina.1
MVARKREGERGREGEREEQSRRAVAACRSGRSGSLLEGASVDGGHVALTRGSRDQVVAPKSEGDQVPLTQTTELEDGTLGERREVGAHQRVGNAAEDDDDDDEATLLADLED